MLQRLLSLSMLCVVLSAPMTSFAQDTTDSSVKNALAAELLEVTESRKLIDQMIPQINTQMKTLFRQALGNQQLDEDLMVVFDRYSERMVEILKQQIRWETLEPSYIKIYTDVFTAEELRELIAFYETPLGQKMLKKMPEIMQASMAISQQQLKDILPQVQALATEMAKEMQAVKAQRKNE